MQPKLKHLHDMYVRLHVQLMLEDHAPAPYDQSWQDEYNPDTRH